ncbi:MAG: 2-hydroxyacid dehydrogenase [Gaiellaceae bacterium]
MSSTSSGRPRVFVTGRVPPEVQAGLEAAFELVDGQVGADGVLSLLTTRVDDAFLEAAGPQLRIVANYAVGVDNIELAAARRRGIIVANTPDVLTGATAELSIALTLALLRRVVEGDRFVRSGRPWGFGLDFMLGESLSGKRFGVVGPGRIGRATARLAGAFGAVVELAGRSDDLFALLRSADVVSLHCPLSPETRHLIDAEALTAMRASAVLVNTSRGAVVDEAALAAALRSGGIAGAALDVYEYEPAVTADLLALDNVVLTPHLGSATRETRIAMGLLAVTALRSVLIDGRPPDNVV